MKYKKLAKQYFQAVNGYDTELIRAMVHPNYIQHNPNVPTGRQAFLDLIPVLKDAGSQIENINLFEDNKHIIMLHKWKNAEPFGASELLSFHIIRFDDRDLIAEHWSLMEPIEKNQSTPDFRLTKTHHVFSEGNQKVVISEGMLNDQSSARYELIQSTNGENKSQKSIVQTIPTENLANNNGMFGFSESA